MKITKRILKEHEGHYQTSSFDYWCVAHGPDYSPKYLGGFSCHDGDECNPECRPCMGEQRCPVPFCNQEEHWDEEQYAWVAELRPQTEGQSIWEQENKTLEERI